MRFSRGSGVLLHISSLAGPHPVGTLGHEAHQFVDFLASAGQTCWQILPLGPTGYGDSPYSTFSAFAGNPLLISPSLLAAKEGIDVPGESGQPYPTADFGQAYRQTWHLLGIAATHCFARSESKRYGDFLRFCACEADWLDDYARFMALHRHNGNRPWQLWPVPARDRDPQYLEAMAGDLAADIRLQQYAQFVFAEQWQALKSHAGEKGVRIIGDLPIFVSSDSADVWAHRSLFHLGPDGQPTRVSGVPPDYFSRTGQRWGNPLYNWAEHEADGFTWWRKRFARDIELCDILRVDHFRGFEACWEIPAADTNAVNGSWQKVPGEQLFRTLQRTFEKLPVIAEDLGLITPEVEQLRDRFNLPGMKVLQFAFDADPENPHWPDNYPENCVVYTGTHDNDTTLGWWQSLPPGAKQTVRDTLHKPRCRMPDDLISVAMASRADLAIFPLQDILGLPGHARMNRPGRESGNWSWRCPVDVLTPALAEKLRETTARHSR